MEKSWRSKIRELKPPVPAILVLGIIAMLLGVFASIPQTQASSVVEKFPTETTEIVAGWYDPTNAYVQDEMPTWAETDTAEQEYSGFEFAVPSDAVIDRVHVKTLLQVLVSYVDIPESSGIVDLNVKVFNGSAWQSYVQYESYCWLGGGGGAAAAQISSPASLGVDVTDFLDTPSKVNSVKVRLLLAVVDILTYFGAQIDVVSVEVAYTTPTEEDKPAAGPGTPKPDWISINLPNLPAYLQRGYDGLQMIWNLPHTRVIIALGLIALVGGVIVKYERRVKKRVQL